MAEPARHQRMIASVNAVSVNTVLVNNRELVRIQQSPEQVLVTFGL